MSVSKSCTCDTCAAPTSDAPFPVVAVLSWTQDRPDPDLLPDVLTRLRDAVNAVVGALGPTARVDVFIADLAVQMKRHIRETHKAPTPGAGTAHHQDGS